MLSLWLNESDFQWIIRRATIPGEVMPPLNSDEVLRAEANTIRPKDPKDPGKETIGKNVEGADLYRALHEQNFSALCLSGGGIRSASFALGVIEALAVNPRPAKKSEWEGDK